MAPLWNADFSLALHNRTGKYHIGRAILQDHAERFAKTAYWRLHFEKPPSGLPARLIGRMLQTELRLRRRTPAALGAAARHRPARAVLHLDPFTVGFSKLEPRDMVLCHDLGPVTHPDLFSAEVTALYRESYAQVVRARPRMVFVSQASRTAFVDRYGLLDDMRVIYPPLRRELGRGATARPVAGLERPFLLSVGSLGRRKNQAAAIAAFAASGLAGDGVELVLCGAAEPGAEAVRAAAEATPGVRALAYVSDPELAWLYSRARGFVLASRLEGFGVPVAEAIAAGLVPLVSSGSVLEEVAGPAALTADPADGAALAAGMRALVEMRDGERRERLDRLGAAIARFTPEVFRVAWRAALDGRPAPEVDG